MIFAHHRIVVALFVAFAGCKNGSTEETSGELQGKSVKVEELQNDHLLSTEFQFNINPATWSQFKNDRDFIESISQQLVDKTTRFKDKDMAARYFFKQNYSVDPVDEAENKFFHVRMRSFPAIGKESEKNSLTIKYNTPLILEALGLKIAQGKWQEVKVEQDVRRLESKFAASISMQTDGVYEQKKIENLVDGTVNKISNFRGLIKKQQDIEHAVRLDGIFLVSDRDDFKDVSVEITMDLHFASARISQDFLETINFRDVLDGEFTFRITTEDSNKKIAMAKDLFRSLSKSESLFLVDDSPESPLQAMSP